jgi:hypothetical protein
MQRAASCPPSDKPKRHKDVAELRKIYSAVVTEKTMPVKSPFDMEPITPLIKPPMTSAWHGPSLPWLVPLPWPNAQAAPACSETGVCRVAEDKTENKPRMWKPKRPDWHSRRHFTFKPNTEEKNSVKNPARTDFNTAKKAKKERIQMEKKRQGLIQVTRSELRAAKCKSTGLNTLN